MLEEARHRLSGRYYFEAEKLFDKAEKELEEKISVWYQRFMKNNGVNNLQQARMLLNSKQLEELQWDIDEYIKYGRENALNQKWLKELENASCKFHITRLEAIKLQLGQVCESLYKKFHDRTEESVKDVFRTNYYKTAYELQRGFEVGFDLNKVDDSMIEKIISKPWAADGKTFSERIWRDKDRLINELHNEMTVNIMTGANPKKLVDSIAKKFNTKKYNAGRLIATEGAFWSSASQKDCFNDLGVEKYKVIATLDEKTSETCQQLDGQVFFMKDFQPGVTAPPFHVNCRSTTAPYFDENFGEIGKRAARDEKGKTYYVPEDMTYPEWKKVFVDKEETLEDWEKRKYNYVKHTEKELYDMANKAKELADKHIPDIESKWSGKLDIVDGENIYGKLWSCNILTDGYGKEDIFLHEILHSKSISYYDKPTFLKYEKIEDASVQLLVQEICKKENLDYVTSYYDAMCNDLRNINRIAKLYDDDYDLAVELFKIPVVNRTTWLYDKVVSSLRNKSVDVRLMAIISKILEKYDNE